MTKRGRNKYVPRSVLDALNGYKVEDGVVRDSEAFDRLVRDAKIGKANRRVERIDPLRPKKRRGWL